MRKDFRKFFTLNPNLSQVILKFLNSCIGLRFKHTLINRETINYKIKCMWKIENFKETTCHFLTLLCFTDGFFVVKI